MERSRRWWKAVVAALAVVLALSVLHPATRSVLDNPGLRRLDEQGRVAIKSSLLRAGATYAVARGVNSVLSVVKGSEISFQFGVGTTIALGEAVDPLDDLVERFSSVMLLSLTSLGVQLVMVDVGAWLGSLVLLPLALLALAMALWRRKLGQVDFLRLAARLFVLAFLVRLTVPAVALFNHLTYELFLQDRAERASEQVEEYSQEMERVIPQGEKLAISRHPDGPHLNEEEQGFWKGMGELLQRPGQTLDLRKRIERLRDKAANQVEHVVQLIVVFVLHTILLPLGFLWVLVKVGGISLDRLLERSPWRRESP